MKSKFVQSALLAVLVGGGALAASAFAVGTEKLAGKPGCEARHGQEARAGWAAHREARLADLKQKLKLTSSQEAAWQTFVQSAQPAAGMQGADREAMRASFASMTAPRRMDAMLQKIDVRREHMAARAEAVKAFYGQLTPTQQAVFDAESVPNAGHRHGQPGGMHPQT